MSNVPLTLLIEYVSVSVSLVSHRGLNFKISQNDTGLMPYQGKKIHEPPTSLKELKDLKQK